MDPEWAGFKNNKGGGSSWGKLEEGNGGQAKKQSLKMKARTEVRDLLLAYSFAVLNRCAGHAVDWQLVEARRRHGHDGRTRHSPNRHVQRRQQCPVHPANVCTFVSEGKQVKEGE